MPCCGRSACRAGAPLPAQPPDAVVELTPSDMAAVVAAVEGAFLEGPEPLLAWVCGPEHVGDAEAARATRRAVAHGMYTWAASLCLHYGRCFAVAPPEGGPTFVSVALCMPPGTVSYGALYTPWRWLATMWREGAPEMFMLHKKANLERFGRAPAQRLDAVDPLRARMHRQHVPGRHWYVYVLGTRPSAQRRGLGLRLLAAVAEKARADGVPVYLETVGDANRAFYERRGFTAVGTVQLPGLAGGTPATAFGMLLQPGAWVAAPTPSSGDADTPL